MNTLTMRYCSYSPSTNVWNERASPVDQDRTAQANGYGARHCATDDREAPPELPICRHEDLNFRLTCAFSRNPRLPPRRRS